ncbi:SusC/RagA family TonB-linked outer membrane protein, partial [Albibacterium sp.]|uniref:SusC/RagA family TonB-linked outer membrane protein n=1 Tax=Albibacterium sp. TaxID=2952885 RepID=UPI002C2E81B5
VAVNNRAAVNVTLAEAVTSLNEVVVTGYTTEQKKDIIGAVSIVNAEDLNSTPTGNITSQLQGRSAGVTVSSDGSLDGGAKVRIRGFGSFSGSEPLYVIDGVPVGGGRSGSTNSAVDNLNPNDIESMQVLKDAAAASIYGARAANGVVIITTKKGQAGTPKITVEGYYGSNYVSKNDFPELLNAQQMGELYWKQMDGAYASSGNPAYLPGGASFKHDQYGSGANPVIPEYILVNNNGTKYGGAALEKMRVSDPALFASLTDPANYDFKTHQIVKAGDTNWFDEVYNPAPATSIQLGARGGTQTGNYALSMNYFKRDNTAAKTNSFERYSLRANSTFNVHKNIRLGENIQVSYGEMNGDGSPGGSGPQAAWVMQPLIPVYDIMGNPASSASPGLVNTNDPGRNPITESWRNRFDGSTNYGIFGNVFGEVDIIKGLTARTSFGVNYSSRNFKNMNPLTYEHAENTTLNSLNNQKNFFNQWTWTNTLNYGKVFAENHDFKILLGSESIRNYGETLSATRTNISVALEDDPNFQVIDAATGAQTNGGSFSRSNLYSLFTRVDYSYAGKYLFNATVRRDESSKFAKDNRVGYFPAAAIGWRVSAEPFMQSLTFLNDLKLRASYGIIGNESGLPNENQYNVYVSSNGQGYPGMPDSYTLNSIANPTAKWEENTTTNIGLDATMFNNSVNFTIEVYNKQTKDLLVRNEAPVTGINATQPYLNAGDMTNKGIDISLSKRGEIADGFGYDIAATFSKYKNEVTRVLDNPLATIVGSGTRLNGSPSLTRVGDPIASFYGYKLDGFFNTQAEVDAFNATYNPDGTTTPWIPAEVGNWRITDVNGDHIINAEDRTIIGSPHPDFQASFNLGLNYKNFDFSAFLFWNKGGQIFNLSRFNVDFNTFMFNRSERMLYESWTPELGNNAKLPKLNVLDSYSNSNVTDYYLESATYLRLKTLQLGYTIPTNVISKAGLDKVRVYVQAQNLFTAKGTNTTVLDPDASLNGGDTSMGVINNTLPTPKQILFGISVGF